MMEFLDWLITFPHYEWVSNNQNPHKAWAINFLFEFFIILPWITLIAVYYFRKWTGLSAKAADRKRREVRKATLWEKLIIKNMPDEVPLAQKNRHRCNR